MKKILTILIIFMLFSFTSCVTLSSMGSNKARENFATKHNMTVVIDNEQMFYAECKNPSLEQKSYVLYYTYKPYAYLNVGLLCYYVDGKFYSKISGYDNETYRGYIELSNEVLVSNYERAHLTNYGVKFYKALLKYHRADLLIKFNKKLGIFIPDDKRKKYQLDNIDKLKKELGCFM